MKKIRSGAWALAVATIAGAGFGAAEVSAQQTARLFLDEVGTAESVARPATPLGYQTPAPTAATRLYLYVAFGGAGQTIDGLSLRITLGGPGKITGWSIYNHVLAGSGPRWASVEQGELSADARAVEGVRLTRGGAAGASNDSAVTALDTAHFRPSAGASDPYGTTLLGYVDVVQAGGNGSVAVRLHLGPDEPALAFASGDRALDTVSLGWGDAAVSANTPGTSQFGEAVVLPLVLRPASAVLHTVANLAGSEVPGGAAGERLVWLGRPAIAADGARFIMTARTDADPSRDGVLFAGSVVPRVRADYFYREGDAAFFDAGVVWREFDEMAGVTAYARHVFTGSVSGAPGADRVLVRFSPLGPELLAREGGQAPGFPAGTIVGTVDSAMGADVQSARARVGPAGASGTGEALVKISTAASTAADVVAGVTTLGGLGEGALVASISAGRTDSTQRIAFLVDTSLIAYHGELSAPPGAREFVAAGSTVLARQGRPLKGQDGGPLVAAFTGRPSMAPLGQRVVFRGTFSGGGSFVAAAQTSGGGATEVLAKAGEPITPGSTEIWSSAAFVIGETNNGLDHVVGGQAVGPGGTAEVLVRNGRDVLARAGDAVDLDGDGLTQEAAFIGSFVEDSGHLTDDGRFYCLVNLRTAAGAAMGQALVGLQRPDVLWDNGPIVTEQGIGPFATDLSRRSDTPGATSASNLSGLADDFVVPAGQRWVVTGAVIDVAQGAQTGTVPTPFPNTDGLSVTIWNGPPGPGAGIVFDGLVNDLIGAGFSGARKELSTVNPSLNEDIHHFSVRLGVVLEPGQYWMQWGSQVYEARAVFVAYNGQRGKPGGNARAFGAPIATGQDLSFRLHGYALPQGTALNETELNNSRETADPFTLLPGDQIAAIAVAGDTDYFRITPAPGSGLRRHTLRLTSAAPGHQFTIRGRLDNQPAADVAIQTGIHTGGATTLAWYSLPGDPGTVTVAVAGAVNTTAPYFMTLESQDVAPVDLSQSPIHGPLVLLTSAGLGHATNTEVQVFDGGFAPIPLLTNNDRLVPFSTHAWLRPVLAAGIYHAAMGGARLVTGVPNIDNDAAFDRAITERPGLVVAEGGGVPSELSFRIGSANGTRVVPGPATEPFSVVFVRMAVAPSQACSAADVATAGNPDPQAGPDGFITGDDFDVFVWAYFNAARNGLEMYIADIAAGGGGGGPDGFLTGADFDRFIQVYFDGC